MTTEALDNTAAAGYWQELEVDQAQYEAEAALTADPAELEAVPVFERASAAEITRRRRYALRAIYGSGEGGKEAVECLSEEEGLNLLNQAARVRLRQVGDDKREETLASLELVRDFIAGKSALEIAWERGTTQYTVLNKKKRTYAAMAHAVRTGRRGGASIVTPMSLRDQKLDRALEEAARRSRGETTGWAALGLCGIDPELFFTDKDNQARINFAKYVCLQCSVRTECLEDALENGEERGIRGGLDEEERRAVVRRRNWSANRRTF